MSRKQHKPTEAEAQLVSLHATIGTPQDLIADIIGIDPKTLRLHYREQLDQSKAKATATIGGALFNKAKGGDTAAMIFWMKTQAGWREVTTLAGDPDNPIKTEEVGVGAAKLSAYIDGIARRGND